MGLIIDDEPRRSRWIREYAPLLLIPLASFAVVGFVYLLAGSKAERGRSDAPVEIELQDDQAPFIVNMPHRYMNLALKCLGADLIVSHMREAPPVVVPNSDACREGSRIPHVDLTAG